MVARTTWQSGGVMRSPAHGVVHGLIIMAIIYVLTLCAFILPHHPCDVLAPLPWLHCSNGR